MMRQMRENTKWIMLITAVAFVALMVFEWGMDLTGRSGADAAGGEIGRINGSAISYEEYLTVYRNLYQQQQAAREEPITAAMNRQIEDAAWDQLVTQRLLEQELRRRKIRITDEEVRDAARVAPPPELQTAPAFQTDGQFDINKYHQFLASPSLDEAFLRQLEGYYRDVLPRSKLYFQNTAGVHVSDGQLWRMWRDANETATVRYVAFSPGDVVPAGEVEVADSDIRAYYRQNREDFLRPAKASVRYVALDRSPPAEDSARARQEAEEYRSAVAGGDGFEAVARRASGSESLTRSSGEEFSVVRGQSAPALDRTVFATAIGEVSEPVLTRGGYHLVKVESRRGDTAQVRQILVPIELSRRSEDRLLDRADSLERVARDRGLQEAASALGLTVRSSELTSALPVLPGVGAVEEGLDWSLNEAEPGEVSDVLEGEQAFYVLELLSREEERVLSLEEATPTIRSLLMREATVARAREVLSDAERRARAGEPLEAIAAGHGGSVGDAGPFSRGDVVPGLGRINAAVGAAFGLQPGQTSPLVEADGQLFIVRTISREEPSRSEWEAQVEAQRARALESLAETRWAQYLEALREDADIVDNRQQLMRRTAGAAR